MKYNKISMIGDLNQYEKDIQSVIRFLKHTDPKNATRWQAIEMLGNMKTLAHLIAHKVVSDERMDKLKALQENKKTPKRSK